MGPRSFERGKRDELQHRRRRRRTSMGPRSFERGKGHCHSASGVKWSSLQWGRVRLNAERSLILGHASTAITTSMGPRSFERGKDDDALVHELAVATSMGPRSFERGKAAIDTHVHCGLLTSMGPRSFERGKDAPGRRRPSPESNFNGAAFV